MTTLSIQETQRRLEALGALFAHKEQDIVNNKSALYTMVIGDEALDIDEIIDFSTSAMTMGFRIVKKGGRVNRETGSRTGTIKQALWVEFNWRKFTDGGFQTTVEVHF